MPEGKTKPARKPVSQRVAEHRARKKSIPPIRRFILDQRKKGVDMPDIYDQTSKELAEKIARDVERLERRAAELNARLAGRAASIPDPVARLRLLGELDRATRIQVDIY
jgi:hypothetical protein